MLKIKRSICYSITEKTNLIIKTLQSKADPPEKTQAWKHFDNDLPFNDDMKFMEFEASLKNDEKKRSALVSPCLNLILFTYYLQIYKKLFTD